MSSVDESARISTDFIDPFDNRTLLAYFEDIFRWHGFIRFVGLPLFQESNSVPISSLFVEPVLAEQHVRAELVDTLVDTMRLSQAVIAYDKLIVLGDPGTGKSTAVSWIARQLTSAFPAELSPLVGYVPIPVVLRELDLTTVVNPASLLSAVLKHPALATLTDDTLNDLLSRGQVLFLLDGLDEIPAALRESVVSAVREAVLRDYAHCRWLITSRVVGYDDYAVDPPARSDERLSESHKSEKKGSVARRYIAPLTDTQIDLFAGRWFRNQEGPEGETHARQFVQAVTAEQQTHQLARVPNLLTLMALIYRVHARLPHGRTLLYDKIADAYLETIDASKRLPASALSLSEKKRVLAYVAFQMQSSLGEGKAGLREILLDGARLRNLIGACIEPSKAVEFVDYLCMRSGVIQQRGPDLYAFAHLSFQDFFAALYLADHVTTPRWLRGKSDVPGTSRDDLRQYFSNVDWRELLVLFFEILAARSGWAEELLVALFDEAIEPPDIQSAAVLAAIATNPYCGLPPELRARTIEAVWVKEITAQQTAEDFFSRINDSVVNVFRAVDEAAAVDVWKGLAASLKVIDPGPTRLKLIDCRTFGDVRSVDLAGTIEHLILDGSSIASLTAVADLNNLYSLFLARTAITEITPVVRFPRLRGLDISDTAVTDVGPACNLDSLMSLYADRLRLEPEQIERFRGLTSLAVQGVPLQDLSFLRHHPEMRLLYVNATKIRDLEPLRRCKELRSLDVSDTEISTLDPLRDLTELRFLLLSRTAVDSIEPLKNLRKIASLSLEGTQVRDIDVLASFSELSWLQLGSTPITNFEPLLALENLESVDLPAAASDGIKDRLRARFPKITFF